MTALLITGAVVMVVVAVGAAGLWHWVTSVQADIERADQPAFTTAHTFTVEPNGDIDGDPVARCPHCRRLAARLPHDSFTLAHLATEADAHLENGCTP